MYVGNPEQLAADYKFVMYFEGSYQYDNGDAPTAEEVQTLLDYVSLHGGGLYVSSEYLGYLQPNDLASVNRILMPLGVESLEVNLNWGGASGLVDIACFPTPEG